MNSERILQYMKDPALLQKGEAKDLQRVLEEYPYSGILHALYLKSLKNQNNYLYPKQLKRTAIAVSNRKLLHTWVEEDASVTQAEEELKAKIVFHPTEPAKEKTVAPPTPVEEKVEEPKVAAVVPAEAPKPVAAQEEPTEIKPVKEDDLDLSNLPASVRETVLRARQIRRQFGGEQAKPATEVVPPSAPVYEPPQPPIPEEKPIEKTAPIEPEPIAPPVVDPPVEVPITEPTEPLPESEIPVEEVVEQSPEATEPVFELSSEDPIVPGHTTPADVFTDAERHSFIGWLQNAEPREDKTKPVVENEPPFTISPDEKIVPTPKTEIVQELYESFMEKPKIKFKAPGSEKKIDMLELNTSGDSDYITETLAQIYTQQKLYNRAMNAYEILRLKYPEKSSFFAAQISEIKQLLKEKD